MIPEPAADSYVRQQGIQNDVIDAATQIWGRRPPRDFDAWFADNVDRLVAIVTAGQQAAVVGTDEYVADTLDSLSQQVEPTASVQPEGLVGVASDGRALDSLMYSPIITAKGEIKKAVEQGRPIGADVVAAAWETGLRMTQLRVQTQVADANRVATGLSVTVRPEIGYVRMLNPPSCSRCAVLAGRFYRFSSGFLRHPSCDCRHIAASEDVAEDVRTDPMDYFASLDTRMQDKIFTVAGAQAIREGADIGQVVNARRGANGLDTAGRLTRRDVYGQSLFTTSEGVTKRGVAGKLIRARGRTPDTTPRLMPEDIYEISGGDRDDALRMLRLNGYILNRSGPRTGAGSRTGLVPELVDARNTSDVANTVDLDAVARAAARDEANRVAAEKLRQSKVLAPSVSAGVPATEIAATRATLDRIPIAAREELKRQYVRLFLTRRVSLLDDAQVRSRYATMVTSDGRPSDEVSFFSPTYGDVIISTDPGNGSLDVVAHELGHALDYRALRREPPSVTWQEQGAKALPESARPSAQTPVTTTVFRIQDDPYVKWAHARVAAGSGPEYYRLGSQGNASSGRAEWIAEGYAAVLNNNRPWLVYNSGGDEQAADILAWTFRRLGVIR
ncbi:hypothetical protein [Rhodococcus sp. 14-2496-1d]|uniref:hypothetical protein n=1 Tax=Rhodococcus sp. 14-2496-1d TaxID=2023146 RepID=UPI0015C5AD6E|nr:hypothetical protein [Rhodococcus sp. 14-2496-1d]